MNLDGFLLVEKETEWTSFDVCAKVRKMYKTRKVGHTGTLDPFATGLLILALGKCTKLIPFLEKAKKTYITTVVLGKTTETLDTETEEIDCGFKGEIPSLEKVKEVIKNNFLGKIEQIPPKYSALKINGKRACDRMREGEDVIIKSRKTEVFKCEVISYSFPEIEIELEVSAGFYVRSFAKELGEMLAGGGYCVSLKRTKIEDILLEDADKIENLSLPLDPRFVLTQIPHREITTGRIQDFIAGRAFTFSGVEGEKVLVLCGNKTLGIGELLHGKLQPRVVM